MGLLDAFARGFARGFERGAKQAIVDDAFERGRKGEPPKVWRYPETQAVADEAYERGQKSAIPNLANKIADKID